MKTLDEVYLIVLPKGRGIVYAAPATNAAQAWANAVAVYSAFGYGPATMRAEGFRARKVRVSR